MQSQNFKHKVNTDDFTRTMELALLCLKECHKRQAQLFHDGAMNESKSVNDFSVYHLRKQISDKSLVDPSFLEYWGDSLKEMARLLEPNWQKRI